jgi:riboflavin biosynthesis pyrimidine reductase/pyrimidine deaminase RibD-like protein
MARPYVVLSVAMSLDGRIDHRGPNRLVLSGEADLARVDAERARSDAILVGGGTLRRDNPRLLVRSPARRAERVRRGLPASPIKVAIARGKLDPGLRFFTEGDVEKLVYTPTGGRTDDPLDLEAVLSDLHGRGVRRLLVEGGTTISTAFLTAGLVDELQLAVAPFFVGDAGAPPIVRDGAFPRGLTLVETRAVGGVGLLRYLLTEGARDRHWLRAAIDLSRRCPPATGAYSVGALIVGEDGAVIASGHSRETDPTVHAEEAALARVRLDDPRLRWATLYSSLEPCSRRKSRPLSCARLIRDAGIRRVVFALREPSLFVDGRGAEELAGAGVTVVELPDLAEQVREVNRHLLAPT